MKRLLVTSSILASLLLSSSLQAAQTWNWSFTVLSGTFTTNEMLLPGTNQYTLDDFILSNDAGLGAPLGSISDGTWSEIMTPSTFVWDSTTETASGFMQGGMSDWLFDAENVYTIGFDVDGEEGLFAEGSIIVSAPLHITPVPLPAAAFLFMTGFIGLMLKGYKARQSVV